LFGSTEKPLPPKGRSVATPFGIADTGLILARPAADGMHQRAHSSTPPDQDHNRNDFDHGNIRTPIVGLIEIKHAVSQRRARRISCLGDVRIGQGGPPFC
jgi:hypothetical protein